MSRYSAIGCTCTTRCSTAGASSSTRRSAIARCCTGAPLGRCAVPGFTARRVRGVAATARGDAEQHDETETVNCLASPRPLDYRELITSGIQPGDDNGFCRA